VLQQEGRRCRHGERIAVLTLLMSALSDWRPEVGFVQTATTDVQ
jgi:hypothetical protein